MVVRRRLRSIVLPFIAYAVSGVLVGYFLHNAKIGSRGLAAKQELKIKIYETTQELDAARQEHADWDERVALLKADHVDRDLLDERARMLLGRVHRNEIIIIGP